MKLGVVGTFIRDRIIPWKGEPISSIGGLFFTVSYLASLVKADVTVCPVAHIGEDFYEEVVRSLSHYGNISFSGLKKLRRQNTQVTLTYEAPQERYEVTTEPMPPLQWDDLASLGEVEALIVNLITGSDLDCSALGQFRRRSDALVYLDLHSRVLGIDESGRRYYRTPPDWKDWLAQVNVLQLNEMEALTLLGVVPLTGATSAELWRFGDQALAMGPDVCHITLGERGSSLSWLADGETHHRMFAASRVGEVIDIIGCGDAFAAAYVAHYLPHGDIKAATQFAIEVSGLNCTFLGSPGNTEVPDRVEKHLARLRKDHLGIT